MALAVCAAMASPAPAEEPAIDPVADKLLLLMANYLRSADEFTFTVRSYDEEVLESGARVQFEINDRVAFRRPDQLTVVSESDLGASRAYFNGVRFSIAQWDPGSDEVTYSSVKAPPTTDELFDFLYEEYGMQLPLGDLLHSNPYSLFSAGLQRGEYVGRVRVDGVMCHQLAFRTEHLDWQVWIEAGWRQVPRKVVIKGRSDPGAPQLTAYLDDWDFRPYLPDSSFSFWLPPDAIRVPLERISGQEEGDK